MNPQQLEKELEQLHTDSFAWALRCCLEDEIGAKEVLQITYLKILEGKAKFKGSSTFKTWLFSVVRFTAIDYYKSQKRKHFTKLEPQHSLIEENSQGYSTSFQQQAVFQEALRQLSPQQNQMMHLVFYQNCSIQEAAEIMGIQLGTARTHYERGKQQLRKWLITNGLLEDMY